MAGESKLLVCKYPGCHRTRRRDSISGMCKSHMHSEYCTCRTCRSQPVERRSTTEFAVPVRSHKVVEHLPSCSRENNCVTLPAEPWSDGAR